MQAAEIYDRRNNLFALRNFGGSLALQKFIDSKISNLEYVLNTHKHKLYDKSFDKECCSCNPHCKRKSSPNQFCWEKLFHTVKSDVCNRKRHNRNIECICVMDARTDITLQELDFSCLSYIALQIADSSTRGNIKELRKMRNDICHLQIGEDPNVDKDEEITKTKDVISKIVSTCPEIVKRDIGSFIDFLQNNPANGYGTDWLSSLRGISEETRSKIQLLVNYPEQHRQLQELNFLLETQIENRSTERIRNLLTKATWIDPEKIIEHCPGLPLDEDLMLCGRIEQLQKIFAVVTEEFVPSIVKCLEQLISHCSEGREHPITLQPTQNAFLVMSQLTPIRIACNNADSGVTSVTIKLDRGVSSESDSIEKIKSSINKVIEIFEKDGLVITEISEGSIVLQFTIHEPIDAILFEERMHTGSIRDLARQFLQKSGVDINEKSPLQIDVQITKCATMPTNAKMDRITLVQFLNENLEMLLEEIEAKTLSKVLKHKSLECAVQEAVLDRPFDRKYHASLILRNVKDRIRQEPGFENLFLFALGKTGHYFIVNQLNMYKERKFFERQARYEFELHLLKRKIEKLKGMSSINREVEISLDELTEVPPSMIDHAKEYVEIEFRREFLETTRTCRKILQNVYGHNLQDKDDYYVLLKVLKECNKRRGFFGSHENTDGEENDPMSEFEDALRRSKIIHWVIYGMYGVPIRDHKIRQWTKARDVIDDHFEISSELKKFQDKELEISLSMNREKEEGVPVTDHNKRQWTKARDVIDVSLEISNELKKFEDKETEIRPEPIKIKMRTADYLEETEIRPEPRKIKMRSADDLEETEIRPEPRKSKKTLTGGLAWKRIRQEPMIIPTTCTEDVVAAELKSMRLTDTNSPEEKEKLKKERWILRNFYQKETEIRPEPMKIKMRSADYLEETEIRPEPRKIKMRSADDLEETEIRPEPRKSKRTLTGGLAWKRIRQEPMIIPTTCTEDVVAAELKSMRLTDTNSPEEKDGLSDDG